MVSYLAGVCLNTVGALRSPIGSVVAPACNQAPSLVNSTAPARRKVALVHTDAQAVTVCGVSRHIHTTGPTGVQAPASLESEDCSTSKPTRTLLGPTV